MWCCSVLCSISLRCCVSQGYCDDALYSSWCQIPFTSAFFSGVQSRRRRSPISSILKAVSKLSRMGVNSSASVSGTRKTCWLECSGSLCVPSSACLVVRRYGTLHAHGREDAQHTSLCFETKHFERSMGGGVASPTAIVPRQLELALQEYEGAREVGVLERLWCRLGPCNVAHARWDLVMMRARPV